MNELDGWSQWALVLRTQVEGAEVQVVFLAATLFEMTASPLLAGFFFFLFLDHALWHMGSLFLIQGWNPGPLQWKHGVLTSGPPGKPQDFYFFDLLICPQFLKTTVGT
jgi:hypothetical protein